jgi:hypothetical protein
MLILLHVRIDWGEWNQLNNKFRQVFLIQFMLHCEAFVKEFECVHCCKTLLFFVNNGLQRQWDKPSFGSIIPERAKDVLNEK